MEKVYNYAFKNNLDFGKLKDMFWQEELKETHRLLYHGSKSGINGEIDLSYGRTNNDFGQGFYVGENFEQAISFISTFENPSLYFIDFDSSNLKCKKYKVDQSWMFTIAYYRGSLNKYKDNKDILELVAKSNDCDYIIAPIADNRMFRIIDMFIDGELTDEQCKHCLAATNLGAQYVFKTQKSIKNIKILEKRYICKSEKKYYQELREKDTQLGDNKVRMAQIKYRGQGKYIDEILK